MRGRSAPYLREHVLRIEFQLYPSSLLTVRALSRQQQPEITSFSVRRTSRPRVLYTSESQMPLLRVRP